jgi:hypothetical protein
MDIYEKIAIAVIVLTILASFAMSGSALVLSIPVSSANNVPVPTPPPSQSSSTFGYFNWQNAYVQVETLTVDGKTYKPINWNDWDYNNPPTIPKDITWIPITKPTTVAWKGMQNPWTGSCSMWANKCKEMSGSFVAYPNDKLYIMASLSKDVALMKHTSNPFATLGK